MKDLLPEGIVLKSGTDGAERLVDSHAYDIEETRSYVAERGKMIKIL